MHWPDIDEDLSVAGLLGREEPRASRRGDYAGREHAAMEQLAVSSGT